jgi:dCMP deaminase
MKAIASSMLSPCINLKVGAVLFNDHYYNIGYNAPANRRSPTVDLENETLADIVHAEMFCMLKTISEKNGASIIVTTAPCINCSKHMVLSGLKNVYFLRHHKNLFPIAYLIYSGVNVFFVQENVYKDFAITKDMGEDEEVQKLIEIIQFEPEEFLKQSNF